MFILHVLYLLSYSVLSFFIFSPYSVLSKFRLSTGLDDDVINTWPARFITIP